MNEPRRPVTTVNTAIEIIDTLVGSPDQTLSEISKQVSLAESTTHRHLATLVQNDLVVRDDDTYRLSFRFLDIGTKSQHQHPLYTAGREYIDSLANETEERIWLATCENGFSVSLYWASDRNPLHQHSRIGTRHHLHMSSPGKAMLAELSDEEVHAIIENRGLPPQTENTITEEERLFDELDEIRERGYATTTNETVQGMSAVAVSVSDDVSGILGAIGIGCSTSRMTNDRQERFASRLLETADEMAIRTRFS
ncbi:IclR family transcriptional regulator [Halobellus captivus]|uniref:IclR family transcriptional regulator n=1 Tax=Halobellus captivus TaxID=2592614 RepID=UPI0011A267F5|nr:IclR family transcriptional regulator [Halobellus captivus]